MKVSIDKMSIDDSCRGGHDVVEDHVVFPLTHFLSSVRDSQYPHARREELCEKQIKESIDKEINRKKEDVDVTPGVTVDKDGQIQLYLDMTVP